MPDLPQDPIAIPAPLMIPKVKLLYVLGGQALLSRRVMCLLLGQPVLKAVQFYSQPSHGTIEVKKVSAQRMLASEFEARKAVGAQALPELPFFACLLAPQPPGVASRIHGVERRDSRRKAKPYTSLQKQSGAPRHCHLPTPGAILSSFGGEGWGALPLN
jgi:hypothetical protein